MLDSTIVNAHNVNDLLLLATSYKMIIVNSIAQSEPEDHGAEMNLIFHLREVKRFIRYCLEFQKTHLESVNDVGSEL